VHNAVNKYSNEPSPNAPAHKIYSRQFLLFEHLYYLILRILWIFILYQLFWELNKRTISAINGDYQSFFLS
jgi:hypothetical protein